MCLRNCGVVLAALLVTTLFACSGRSEEVTPVYHLDVRLEPEAGRIECIADIVNPPDARFRLSGDMEISRILADGKQV